MPQLFLGWLLGTRLSAIGQFFSMSLVTVPEVFVKLTRPRFPLLFKVASSREVFVAFYINMYR